MTADDHHADNRRQTDEAPECEACGEVAPEGGGANLGDETFGWVCTDCLGDSALVEYGIIDEDEPATDAGDGLVEVEVVVTVAVGEDGGRRITGVEVR